jgi:hypothetical protein
VFDKCDAIAAVSHGVVPSENHIEHHTTSTASFATAVDNSLVCGVGATIYCTAELIQLALSQLASAHSIACVSRALCLCVSVLCVHITQTAL